MIKCYTIGFILWGHGPLTTRPKSTMSRFIRLDLGTFEGLKPRHCMGLTMDYYCYYLGFRSSTIIITTTITITSTMISIINDFRAWAFGVWGGEPSRVKGNQKLQRLRLEANCDERWLRRNAPRSWRHTRRLGP